MRTVNLWNETDDAMMAQLIKEGFTASEIAARLPGNRSRCAIIGRSHRAQIRLNPYKGGSSGRRDRTWLFGNRNNLWQLSEDAILRNNWASMGADQEGILPGRTFRAIQQRATKLGIRVRRERVRAYNWQRNHKQMIFQPAPDHGCKTFMEVGHSECRFGYGDPLKLDEFRFCGQQTNGSSWCPAHSHVVFNMEKC